mgnify:CR=1 FL=1
MRIGFYPNQQACWYWACLVGEGRRPVMVVDHDVPPPRRRTLEVRHDGLWADHTIEVPFDHATLGCEAFGLVLDGPTDAYRPLVGERVPFGLDLEWGEGGNLWAQLFGTETAHIVAMVIGYAIVFSGATLVADGWRRIHRARREDTLMTDGVYARMRHPQYTGLFLIVFGEGIVHWPTIVSVAAFPIIVFAYTMLARREERQMLEDHLDVAPVGGKRHYALALEPDIAGGGRLEAGDHPHQRGLAAAGRAEQREELAVLDGQRQVVDRREVPEPFRDPFEPNVSVGHQRLANLVALL